MVRWSGFGEKPLLLRINQEPELITFALKRFCKDCLMWGMIIYDLRLGLFQKTVPCGSIWNCGDIDGLGLCIYMLGKLISLLMPRFIALGFGR